MTIQIASQAAAEKTSNTPSDQGKLPSGARVGQI